ncbi:hypothetical protein I4U23_020057 [Adineta vaga]|nr:hypothetical protein I4U23_020057 [Adineta vaga]
MHTVIVFLVLFSLINCITGTFVCNSDGMFENVNDPNTFWHCAHGINYLKHCPTTLVWSQETQQCIWNTNPIVIVTESSSSSSSSPVTTTSTETVPITEPIANGLPPQCSTYTSITDATRRTNNTNMNAETDHSFFSSTPVWVRFEGAAGTRLADYSVPYNRCGSEGAGWLKHPTEPEVGETINQKACFNWSGMSCIWPEKIPQTNCGDFFVYALVAPRLSHARYCTI